MRPSRILDLFEGALQVGDDVVPVFEADTNPYAAGHQPALPFLLLPHG